MPTERLFLDIRFYESDRENVVGTSPTAAALLRFSPVELDPRQLFPILPRLPAFSSSSNFRRLSRTARRQVHPLVFEVCH
jgi:hypothetical protein